MAMMFNGPLTRNPNFNQPDPFAQPDPFGLAAPGYSMDAGNSPASASPPPRPFGMFAAGGRAAAEAARVASQQPGAQMQGGQQLAMRDPGPLPGVQADPSAMSGIAQAAPKVHPGFFAHGGTGEKIAGFLGNALIGLTASTSPYSMMVMRERFANRAAQRQQQLWEQRHDMERQESLSDLADQRAYEAGKPVYREGASDLVRYDPKTNSASVVYDAPMPAEAYARNFGEPGTEGYRKALSDYTLRSWGPTAVDGRTDLNDARYQQRVALKGMPTYANLHPRTPAPRPAHAPTTNNVVAGIMAKIAGGQPLTPGETQIYQGWQSRGRGGRTSYANVPTGSPLAPQGGAPVRVATPAEAAKLPPGTSFIGPDGVTRVRH